MRIIYITTRNSGEAKKIANSLLKKRLVACANIFPIESMYWLEGEIEENIEFAVLLKTADSLFDAVEKAVKSMHSYEIPAIYSWKTDKVSREYENWVRKEVKE